MKEGGKNLSELLRSIRAGKTRTVIALCDLLMRCNWAKRVLFLADRVALVRQAVNAFEIVAPDGQHGSLSMGPAMEQEIIWDLFGNVLAAAREHRDIMRQSAALQHIEFQCQIF